ncbi:hypothetical protein ACVIWV_001937 [Bradyrhizobium diazoefficiens]|uniref:hypothetical protein n=1 Tax=Bradyrhizobium TaxID=374 RepID=UPI0007658182|nr:hypothetical protein [Bradyrhizobium diazoefficiens]MBR0866735.1 hypothetical protein [Bradyrhizobium diazoefficiens]MBR0891285.1 hypothetical protein [Bradyrhizobium diazoefficiens]MBR0922988.1 hypothetical protein [Bradyrhizobium diazoefficiens]
MAPNSKSAGPAARPADLKYFADGNVAVVLIPRQLGEGHDVIELRKNPTANSKRRLRVQLNGHPRFSISERQLLSLYRFQKVAARQLSARPSDHEQWLRDILGLQESGWGAIVERLIAMLLAQGGGE